VQNTVHDEEFRLYRTYGTSLSGCIAEGHKINFRDYFKRVHGPLPYDQYLTKDPELREVLRALPGRRVGFTNSDSVHTAKVLAALGISDCFHDMFTFEKFNPAETAEKVLCKPNPEVFTKVLADLRITDPSTVVFLDDSRSNIKAGKAAGLFAVIVGSDEKCEGADAAVKSLKDIMQHVPELFGKGGSCAAHQPLDSV
jgi:pyrimidine 5'-nucleotidase